MGSGEWKNLRITHGIAINNELHVTLEVGGSARVLGTREGGEGGVDGFLG